jgi:hypothetical protein
MTVDAERWFEKNCIYDVVDHADVPADIASSGQFTHICPVTKSLMVVSIKPDLNPNLC